MISKPQDRKLGWHKKYEILDRRYDAQDVDPSKRHRGSAARAAREQYAAQNEIECENNAWGAPFTSQPIFRFGTRVLQLLASDSKLPEMNGCGEW